MIKSIVSIIFIAASIMVFVNWIQPSWNEIKDLRLQEAAFNQALADSKELQKIRDELLQEYNSIDQKDLERLNSILPPKMEAIKLVVVLEEMTKRHNLILKNIDVKKVESEEKATFGPEEKAYNEVPISMSVIGRYKNFVSFLGELEESLNLIDITQLGFSAGEVDSYDFNIKAKTYWKK